MFVKSGKLLLVIMGFYYIGICDSTYVINESDFAYKDSLIFQSKDSIVFKITLKKFSAEEVVEDENTYIKLSIPDEYIFTGKIGYPKLPIIKSSISLPEGYSVDEIVESNKTFEGYSLGDIYPTQESYSDCGGEEPPFFINTSFYSSSQSYPDDNIISSNVQYFRIIRFIEIGFVPFTFYPETDSISVISSIKLSLQLKQNEAKTKDLTLLNKKDHLSMDKVYDKYFLNYNKSFVDIDNIRLMKPRNGIDKPSVLFITPDELEDACKEYADERGMQAYFETFTSTSIANNIVKGLVSDYYKDPYKIRYAILIGDHNTVERGWTDKNIGATLEFFPNDFWYGNLTTGDYTPEVIIGRFSINTSSGYDYENQLRHMFEKHLNYVFKKKTGIISGKEGHYENCCESIVNTNYSQISSDDFHKIYGSSGASNADISDVFKSDDYGIVLYRGHGSIDGFDWKGTYGTTELKELEKISGKKQFSVLLTSCCYVSRFANTTSGYIENIKCFSEYITRMHKGKYDIGDRFGVSLLLGATAESWPDGNRENLKLLSKKIFDREFETFGEANANTQTELILNSSGVVKEDAIVHQKMYIWLGDPSLEIYKEGPVTLK